MRLGLFGGTFNPIHLGHLRAGLEIQERFSLDRVLYLPAAIPPHKATRELLSFAHRLKMVRLAVRGSIPFKGLGCGNQTSREILFHPNRALFPPDLPPRSGSFFYSRLGRLPGDFHLEGLSSTFRTLSFYRPGPTGIFAKALTGISFSGNFSGVRSLSPGASFPSSRWIFGLLGTHYPDGHFFHPYPRTAGARKNRRLPRPGSGGGIYPQRKGSMETKKKPRSNLSAREKALVIAQTALQKKPVNPIALQVEGLCSFAEYFLILSGNSTRQTQALAGHLRTALGKKGIRPLGVEGEEPGQWILMDYDEVIVHIFLDTVRDFYDVEGLWIDAPRLDLPEGPIPSGAEPRTRIWTFCEVIMFSKFFFCLRLGILSLILFGVGVFPWVPIFNAANPAYAITLEEEQKLGDQVLREVEAHFTLIRDPLLLNYSEPDRTGNAAESRPHPLPLPLLPAQGPPVERLFGTGRAYFHYHRYPGGHGFGSGTGRVAGARNRARNIPPYCQADGTEKRRSAWRPWRPSWPASLPGTPGSPAR